MNLPGVVFIAFQNEYMTLLPNRESYGDKVRAIIYCNVPQVNGNQFLKYNYVDNTPRGLQTFINWARRFPGAEHINFYCKQTGQFIEQHKY